MARLSHPSPNFGERRGGARPRLIVVHYTAMPTAAAALDRLCDPAAEVSAHYLIGRDGTCCSLVHEDARAWHAGAGSWRGVADVNSASIGIELDNDGTSPFSAPLMSTLEALLGDVMGRWNIPPEGVIAHADMAPERKSDPGARFDWRRLALAGLSVWPAAGAPPGDFDRDAAAFGYPADAAPDRVLSAFRSRFRPYAAGPVDDADRAMIADLACRYSVDPRRGGA